MNTLDIAPLYSKKLIKRMLASGIVGNIIETYDLILISLMATTLGRSFFPPVSDPYTHVIDILYVFLIGLLVRPLGNILMGLFADQIGRKKISYSFSYLLIFSSVIGFIGLLFLKQIDTAQDEDNLSIFSAAC